MLKILGCINEEQMETQAKILKLVSSHSVKTSLAISSSKRENFHSFRSNIDPQKLFSLYHFLPVCYFILFYFILFYSFFFVIIFIIY